jgi:hypothetical protein
MTGALDPAQLTPLLFMGGILLCLALIAFGTARRYSRLRQGVLADGVVSGKELERDEGKFYYVSYNFADASGARHTKKIEVTRRHFDMLSEGQPISVIYDADKPDNSFINDGELRRSFFKGFNILIGGAVVLAICGYGLIRSFN